MKRTAMVALTLIVLAAATAGASEAERLLGLLAGDDDVARCEARQMLPRESVDIVPRLVALIGHKNPQVWNAAFGVAADFANGVSTPGREKDRRKVTGEIMKLVAADQPVPIKERGLKLLVIVVPEGYDIGPMAALLGDADLREKAREALQELGTTEARKALRKALKKADPAFQCALLDSLGFLRDKKSLRVIARLTESKDANVRVCAARALAWTGDVAYVKTIEKVVSAADAATAFDASDAMVRLAQAMAAKGDAGAMGVFRGMLNTNPDLRFKGAALAGLVTWGGEGASANVAAALAGPNGRELEAQFLEACENGKSPAANGFLLAVYPQLAPNVRVALLELLGRKKDVAFLPVMTAALEAEPDAYKAGLCALVASELPEATAALSAVAQKKTGDDKACAVAALKNFADSLKFNGKRDQAGQAYLALYNASDGDTRKEALQGITKYPTNESADVVMKAVAAGEITENACTTLAVLAKSLTAANRKEDAARAADLIVARAKTPAEVEGAINAAQVMGGIPELGRRLGFVIEWQLVGPFPWSLSDAFTKINIGEPAVDIKAVYNVGGKELKWIEEDTKSPMGVFDLQEELATCTNSVGYGFTTIEVDEAADATARMGSDDGIKLWVNGEAVHEHNIDRGCAVDSDIVPIKLKKGANTLLVEVTQGGGGWNFCLRLTQPDGTPLKFK